MYLINSEMMFFIAEISALFFTSSLKQFVDEMIKVEFLFSFIFLNPNSLSRNWYNVNGLQILILSSINLACDVSVK